MAEASSQKVAAKIIAVMGEIESVSKKGTNVAQHYKYASEADVVEVVRAALIKHRLVVIPSVVNQMSVEIGATQAGNKWRLTEITVKYTWIDADSGESIETLICGQGVDTGDKGVYKAMTGANKYALLKTFQLPTDDDPEAGEEPRLQQSRANIRQDPGPKSDGPTTIVARFGTAEKPNYCWGCSKRHIVAGDKLVEVGRSDEGKARYAHEDCAHGVVHPKPEPTRTPVGEAYEGPEDDARGGDLPF